ncbi:MAG: hypothetical protein NC548_40645 [Lachnospiraceae bacterium]|nr:hypothetical protein [Lachnospiraceae bacterium]
MTERIKVGSRVRHQNLTCMVVSIHGNECELQPVGSSARYSAPLRDVTLIMNEGTREDVDNALFS